MINYFLRQKGKGEASPPIPNTTEIQRFRDSANLSLWTRTIGTPVYELSDPVSHFVPLSCNPHSIIQRDRIVEKAREVQADLLVWVVAHDDYMREIQKIIKRDKIFLRLWMLEQCYLSRLYGNNSQN